MSTYTESEIRWIWLSSIDGMTPRRFYRLLTLAEDPSDIWDEPEEYLYDTDEKLKGAVLAARSSAYIDAYFENLEKRGIRAVSRTSSLYPDSLQHIHDAPPTLYIIGNTAIERERAIAVVGTRSASWDGQKAANDFTEGLAKNGVTIVSGLARGIDTFAHKACLRAGGHTVAVLGNGLNTVYPPENEELARRIVDSGGSVISEMRPQDAPTRWSFPQRNRIISGLSNGSLIIEGSAKSGAMITAGCALDEGKDVFAVPGSPYSPGAEGPNILIKNGASPALSYWDILEGMHWASRPSQTGTAKIKAPELDGDEKIIYNALSKGPMSFDEISQSTLFSASKLNSCLTMLILRGIIIKLPGNMYRTA